MSKCAALAAYSSGWAVPEIVQQQEISAWFGLIRTILTTKTPYQVLVERLG
jgi:hypothetical protein